MCFFFYVYRHFLFHQTYAGARKKQNAQRKKKQWLSVQDYLTDRHRMPRLEPRQ